jgi:hypothetical protein
MPKLHNIQFLRKGTGYQIVLKEELIGNKNLGQEIQDGLPIDVVKGIFRQLLHVIAKIKNDSEEDLLTPMIELKPENLVRNSNHELVFVDEFPPRLLEPWNQALWPAYGNPSLEWRQQKAIVHGGFHHILRYLLLSFTIIRDDLEPQQFLEEISSRFNWTPAETDQFMSLVSQSENDISPRRRIQAISRGVAYCKYFGLNAENDTTQNDTL